MWLRFPKRGAEAMPDEQPVLYEERDTLAIITLNRPEKLNTLNEAVIQGIADAVAAAAASRAVRAIVLRGAGRAFTAGYDLNPRERIARRPRYDAPSPEPRPGAWDPVRDLQFMGHNMRCAAS
jgi:enoyl-CoA hydratase/carnithine racemase